MRPKANVPQRARSRSKPTSVPAPVLGWISAQNLAAGAKGSAVRLEGWFPTTRGIRMLGGSLRHATVAVDLPC